MNNREGEIFSDLNSIVNTCNLVHALFRVSWKSISFPMPLRLRARSST